MILSMTGFGRGCALSEKKKISVEIKSLNSKQLDMTLRIPAVLREAELPLRSSLAPRIERGKTEVNVNVESLCDDSAAVINIDLLKQYRAQLQRMASEFGIEEPEDWYSILMRMPDAMKTEYKGLNPDDINLLNIAVDKAATFFKESRRREGEKLYWFFKEKIERIRCLLSDIEPYEAERVPKVRERLEEQLNRLESIEFDRARLEQELIYYIEKLDVNEEKLRLRSHMAYFLETLGPETGIPESGQGKKLGFIAQEIGREINTLGSKSNHAEMQKIVVKMKDELEQIKEQVLNVL